MLLMRYKRLLKLRIEHLFSIVGYVKGIYKYHIVHIGL
jgi:hypothetical protein